jgi:hypothetical protein
MRYGALKFVSSFYKFIGFLILVISIVVLGGSEYLAIQTVLAFNERGGTASLDNWITTMLAASVPAAVVFVVGMFFYGFGQLLSVLIDIEANTRYLRGIYRQSPPPPIPDWMQPPDAGVAPVAPTMYQPPRP